MATIQRAISQGEVPTSKFLIRAMAENGVTPESMRNAISQGLMDQKLRGITKRRSPQALLNLLRKRGFDFGD